MIEHLDYWRAQSRWTLEQAAQLLCDREPQVGGFDRVAIDPGGPNDIYCRIKNAKEDDELKTFPARGSIEIRLERVRARDVVAWALRSDWPVPQGLRDLATAPIPAPVGPDAHISETLVLVNRAAVEFWKTADPEDPDTQPNNDDVVAWLVSKGLTKAQASSAASIIRPSWAFVGRRPMK